MEFLFDLIIELFSKDNPEVYMEKRMSKAIRYPLFFIISIAYFALLIISIIFGFNHVKINPTGSVLIITVCFALIVLYIVEFIFMFKKHK